MVAGHRKLCMLLFYNEIVEFVLLRELVAQAHAVVVHAETYDDVALCGWLVESNGHLLVVVAYGCGLSPYRFPRLVERRRVGLHYGETVHKVGFLQSLAGVLVLGKLQSEMARLHYSLAFVIQSIRRPPVVKREIKHNIAVGRCNSLRQSCQWHQQSGQQHFYFSHSCKVFILFHECLFLGS